jgi:4-amino-4-deoxy-L-arabinose transferase-like glycosyltransferase
VLVRILAFALAVRWLYCLGLYFAMGDDGITGVDSSGLLGNATHFASLLVHNELSGWQWFGVDPFVMPLFTWTAAINVLAFGKWATLSYVLLQSVLDTATCYFVYRMADAIEPRIALPAVISATINPTQIVLCGYFYNDTAFVFFVALFLYGAVAWLASPTWRATLLIGVGLGAGMLIRPVMAPWVPPFMLFLLAITAIRRDLSARRFGQIVTATLIFSFCLGAIVTRNAAMFGVWSITPQSGMHLSRWIAPLVREAKDGTPWEKTYKALEARTTERFGPPADSFTQSDRYKTIAIEELRELGLGAVIKAWVFGAAINLSAPAVILSQPVAHLPRTGFYGTPGESMTDKIWNFLFHSENNTYALILLAGILGVGLIRLIQAIGGIALITSAAAFPVVLLFIAWTGYILLANGPIASPKYRLPLEPVFCILTGAGWATLMRRSKKPDTA